MSFDNGLWLMHGDCLERMKEIPDGSVDAVICDPPYGTTACEWDSVISLEPMWAELKRVIKPRGAIVLTASQPFTTTLIASNMKGFKYCWVWRKRFAGNFATAKYRPLKDHEDIAVFGKVGAATNYHPQMIKRDVAIKKGGNKQRGAIVLADTKARVDFGLVGKSYTHKHPTTSESLQYSSRDGSRGLHPTQKPVALMEYLIKTYTNEGETVLDFTMGSGTTGVAALQSGRKFIGIERDDVYFEMAKRRIEDSRGLF